MAILSSALRIEVGVSTFQVIVKVAAAGDYLVDQKGPLIGSSVKPGNLHQMFEDRYLAQVKASPRPSRACKQPQR